MADEPVGTSELPRDGETSKSTPYLPLNHPGEGRMSAASLGKVHSKASPISCPHARSQSITASPSGQGPEKCGDYDASQSPSFLVDSQSGQMQHHDLCPLMGV